jgi:hypothetical protein
VALRSPTQTHNYWGNGFAAYAQLPNVAGSPVQNAGLEEGDTAYIPSLDQLYVCVDPSLGAAVWEAQAFDDATRIIHTPGATPSKSTLIPGQGPEPVTFGAPVPDLVGLHYKRDDDLLYGYSKIQTTYISDASFHIHWTKNVDTNEAGATVRWVVTYKVYNGISQDVSGAATGTLLLDDTYVDAGTTTRIVYRTANAPAPGFVAGWYVGFSIGFDPANTTLNDRPTIISCDILSRNTINLGN